MLGWKRGTCRVEGGGLGDNRLDGSWDPYPWCISSPLSFSENSPVALRNSDRSREFKARVCWLGPCKVLPHVSLMSLFPPQLSAPRLPSCCCFFDPGRATPRDSPLLHALLWGGASQVWANPTSA